MNKESKLNLNAGNYAIHHCILDQTYNGLEVHKMLCDAYIAGNNDTLEDEDERIRKALINVFATHKDYEMFFGVSVEDIHAWLERQGEHTIVCGEEQMKLVEADKSSNWTEKDDVMLKDIISILKDSGYTAILKDPYINWVNSLKERLKKD